MVVSVRQCLADQIDVIRRPYRRHGRIGDQQPDDGAAHENERSSQLFAQVIRDEFQQRDIRVVGIHG